MGEKDSGVHAHKSSEALSDHDSDFNNLEPIVYKREPVHEMFAREMRDNGFDGEALELGSSSYEKGAISSRMFQITSLGTTNRGVIRVRGHFFDFIQIFQRG